MELGTMEGGKMRMKKTSFLSTHIAKRDRERERERDRERVRRKKGALKDEMEGWKKGEHQN